MTIDTATDETVDTEQEFDGGTAATQLEELKPSVITAHPKNPRKALGDIAELAASIKGEGIIEPLIVTPAKGKGKYTLIAGHRRHAAAKKAGLKSVPCLIRFDLEGDDRAQLEVMLTENLHRSDLNAIEEGSAYQTLLEFDDVDIKGLASRTGHNQKTIRDRIKLANSPESLQRKIIARQVTLEEALALAEFADDQQTYDRLALHLGSRDFQVNLQRAREARLWEKRQAKITKQLADRNIRVTTNDELSQEEADSNGTVEWFEVEEDDVIPEGTETAAVLNENAHDGYIMHFKRIVETSADGKPIPPAPQPKPEETPEQIEAREQREREKALDADLRTAATVRRRYLAGVAADHDEDLALKALRQLVMNSYTARVENPYYAPAARELVGVPPSTKDDDDAHETAQVTQHVNKMSIEQLAVTLWLLDHVAEEYHMARARGWTMPTVDLTPWQQELTELGYEYSTVELSMLEVSDGDAAEPADTAAEEDTADGVEE
ncbi:ParB/RepB/Spo0J family partition protein [Rhodococcus sp. 1R11]|uniref:ParB/RepB/Spo0J family partition protein n=1 Tax=Rhodococcus sp. 1R11 TaxID=2559614 RepID=UPI00107265D0|nr:ParB/RepB/Spo0J family partition protein [Rhodococcus sp. 1R11]TFI42072.1 ParB/RepB/Spo0J family partition protein [Rhodococcus sp. 1R11]